MNDLDTAKERCGVHIKSWEAEIWLDEETNKMEYYRFLSRERNTEAGQAAGSNHLADLLAPLHALGG